MRCLAVQIDQCFKDSSDSDFYSKNAPRVLLDEMIEMGHYEFLSGLIMFHETDEYWFSHAPIPSVEYFPQYEADYPAFFKNAPELLLWTHHSRMMSREGMFEHDHGKLAVCGHVVNGLKMRPRIYPHLCCNDSGSGYEGGALSCLELRDGVLAAVYIADEFTSWELELEHVIEK